MKFISSVFLCLVIVAVVAAEYGYYVPKAFYKINENGIQSPVYYIEVPEEAVHPRFRRSAQGPPPYNPFGPGFVFPNFGQGFPQINPGAGGQYSGISTQTSTQTGGDLASRFGDEDSGPQTNTQTTVVTHKDGVITETTHTIGADGIVHTSTVNRGQPNSNSKPKPKN